MKGLEGAAVRRRPEGPAPVQGAFHLILDRGHCSGWLLNVRLLPAITLRLDVAMHVCDTMDFFESRRFPNFTDAAMAGDLRFAV